MTKPFVIAHVSDFHVSTFGDTFHDRARIVKRSARIADTSEARFEEAWAEAGWRVLREKGTRKSKLVIVDPDGYSHPTPSPREGAPDMDPLERAAAKACRLEARRASTLAKAIPSEGATSVLFEATPKNSNVRLLRAAAAVATEDIDLVIATGDLTDDGDGYDLVYSAFAKWAERGRLLAIPGNHDIYLFPLAGSGRPRATHESKRAAWSAFAGRLGLVLDASGAWTKEIPDARAIIVGLNTCARPQRRFFRHNGAVGPAQIAYLRALAATPAWKDARHRIVALHHHVVPLPHGIGRRAPSEIGMRLDDAKEAAGVLNEIGATFVLHGHRHISEERQPAGLGFRLLAAPSLTLGCKSGDGPSFWRLELDERAHVSRVYVPVDAIPQEDDPSAGVIDVLDELKD